MVGDDGKRLDRRSRQLATRFALDPHLGRQILGRAESPLVADPTQGHAPRLVEAGQLLKHLPKVRIGIEMACEILFAERLRRREEQGLKQPDLLETKLAHLSDLSPLEASLPAPGVIDSCSSDGMSLSPRPGRRKIEP